MTNIRFSSRSSLIWRHHGQGRKIEGINATKYSIYKRHVARLRVARFCTRLSLEQRQDGNQYRQRWNPQFTTSLFQHCGRGPALSWLKTNTWRRLNILNHLRRIFFTAHQFGVDMFPRLLRNHIWAASGTTDIRSSVVTGWHLKSDEGWKVDFFTVGYPQTVGYAC